MNDNAAYAHLSAGSNNTQRNLPTIGNQNGMKHFFVSMKSFRKSFDILFLVQTHQTFSAFLCILLVLGVSWEAKRSFLHSMVRFEDTAICLLLAYREGKIAA